MGRTREARGGVTLRRRLPIGAELDPEGGAHVRVWAPKRRRVEVALEGDDAADGAVVALDAEPDGYFSGFVARAQAGSRYRLRLDGEAPGYPDPASRFQPDGPHGPS